MLMHGGCVSRCQGEAVLCFRTLSVLQNSHFDVLQETLPEDAIRGRCRWASLSVNHDAKERDETLLHTCAPILRTSSQAAALRQPS